MANLVKEGNKIKIDYQEYYIDTAEELSNIDTNNCCAGSVAFIINTGAVYMLNNAKEWKEI